MPRGDKTGPSGQGPMTGRAAGYCSGSGVPGYANPAPGMGMAYGRDSGRGRGGGYRRRLTVPVALNPVINQAPLQVQPIDPETTNVASVESPLYNEINVLKEQVDYITKTLASISEKLEVKEKSTGKAE